MSERIMGEPCSGVVKNQKERDEKIRKIVWKLEKTAYLCSVKKRRTAKMFTFNCLFNKMNDKLNWNQNQFQQQQTFIKFASPIDK